jgi:hypothetical protein
MANIIQLRSRNAVTGDAQTEYDAQTNETIQRYAAVILDEDFCGPGHTTIPTNGSPATGYAWVQRIVGAAPPTATVVANYPGGLIRLALAATSEAEEADFYANDMLNWDVTKSANFECRLSNHVLPSVAGVEFVFGLQSAWVSGPDNASFYAQFQQNGSGTVNMRTKDGVNTLTGAVSSWTAAAIATGVTTTYTGMQVDVFHNFRIDATDVTNVRFFIDNVEVSTKGQFTFAATGASAILQPYFAVYKPSGTGVGTMDIDSVQVTMNRV